MEVSIIGHGYVGQAYNKIFPDAYVYDEPKGIGSREEANKTSLSIVCVPTQMKEDGTCDVSIVEDVVSWLQTPLILIKSTVVPGTTERLKQKYDKRICFSPEYIGEGKYWTPDWKYPNPKNPISHGFMIVGGDSKDCQDIMDFFVPILGPSTHFRAIASLEAEVIKYAENIWGATKVIFSHMLRDVCEKIGANWYNVREGWLDDPRMEEMHTAVFGKNRGFGGKCYPKDLSAFIKFCDSIGYNHTLLKAVWNKNEEYTK